MAARTVTKVQYVDNETVIRASNLNAIQDAINDHASLIDGLDTNKVSKVAGKGLSTNDFTNDARDKLSGLPTGTDLDTTLETKVEKRTASGTEVYTHTGATQGGKTLTETPTAGAVPLYGTGGVLKAAVPVADNDVVRKAEVDEVVDELSDSATGLGSKAPAIVNTVSGAIASFPDGADSMPVKELVVAVEPVQDLNGYDHPWPGGGGKNILQMIAPSAARGISFSLNDDGSLHVSGTATADATFYINGSTYAGNNTAVIPAGTYTAFCQTFMTNGNENTRVTFNGKKEDGTNPSSNTLLARADGSRNTITFTTAEPFKAALYLVITSGEVCDFDIKIQLEAGSTATAYEPYSNECPISGWTGAEATRTGKNLLAVTQGAGTTNGITFSINSDGTVNASGTASANVYRAIGAFFAEKGVNYILSGCPSDGASSKYRMTIAGYGYDFGSGFSFVGDGASHNVSCDIYPNAGNVNIVFKPMIRFASDTDATFEPHIPQSLSVTFPSEAGTVYGGTLTINPDRTGALVVDRAMYSIKNSSIINKSSLTTCDIYIIAAPGSMILSDKTISDTFKYTNSQNVNKVGEMWLGSTPTQLRVGFAEYGTTTVEGFTAWLNENDPKIIEELASPITYTLTASEIDGILTTLYGTNNIWADCGDSTVTYAADTKLYIEHLTQPTEDDMTADHAISAGTFFMIGNTLYLATSQIAAGATITPGTNATQLSLADALNQLNT